MKLLEAAGYSCTKSGASLGAWDVIAIGSADFVVCQVKSNSWPGVEEMETLRSFHARRIAASWCIAGEITADCLMYARFSGTSNTKNQTGGSHDGSNDG